MGCVRLDEKAVRFLPSLTFLFLQMPTLMKATVDDEAPCPGYLFEEISSILFPAMLKSRVYTDCIV